MISSNFYKNPSWTDEDKEVVRALYSTMRAALIGEKLGRSKNAIIGMAKRLGLATPKATRQITVVKEGAVRHTKVLRALAEMVASASPKPAPIPVVPPPTPEKRQRNIPLVDLLPDSCRWPIGDPKKSGFHFCAARQSPGRPYCTKHWLESIPH